MPKNQGFSWFPGLLMVLNAFGSVRQPKVKGYPHLPNQSDRQAGQIAKNRLFTSTPLPCANKSSLL